MVWRRVGMAVEQTGGVGTGGWGGWRCEMRSVRVVSSELDKKKSGGRRLTKVARDEPKKAEEL